MAIDYEKNLVRKPRYEVLPGVENRQSPVMTLMSRELVPGADYYLTLGWVYGIPRPNPHVHEHVHDWDEIVLFIGGDPDFPRVLGGEVEFCLGGQPVTFNTTTSFFVPKGTKHGPVTWKGFTKPHLVLSLMLGSGNPPILEAVGEGSEGGIPRAAAGPIDYESYAIRSPLYELGDPNTKGRQYPSMTYMSRLQVPQADYYIEFSWLFAMPEPNPHIMEHGHDAYDEIVLHFGGDPKSPLDLGGEIEFRVEGQPLTFNTATAVFLPRGVKHGPLTWKEFHGPHIEMAIMLGAGSFAEGWGGRLPQ